MKVTVSFEYGIHFMSMVFGKIGSNYTLLLRQFSMDQAIFIMTGLF